MRKLPTVITSACAGAALAFACTVGGGLGDTAQAQDEEAAVVSAGLVLELSYDANGVACLDAASNRPINNCCPEGFSEVGVNARGGPEAATVCYKE